MTDPMSNAQTQRGSCHCGKVRYEVELDLSQPVIRCNCSMCQRAGTMLAFTSSEGFKLLSGDDALTSYHFNKNVIDHLFCSTCGIKSFARGVGQDGKPMVAVNVRCLEGVDVATLKTHDYDGRAK
jgi:hypothetical protein